MSSRIVRRWAAILFASCCVSSAAAATPQIVFGAETGGTTYTTPTSSPNTLMAPSGSLKTGGAGQASSTVTLNDTRGETFAALTLAADGISPILRAKSTASQTAQHRAANAYAFAMQTYQYLGPTAGAVTYEFNLHATVNDPSGSVIGRAAAEVILAPEFTPQFGGTAFVSHIPTLWFEAIPSDVRAVSDRASVALNSTISDGNISDSVTINLAPGQYFYLAERLDAGAAWFGSADASQSLTGSFTTGGQYVQVVPVPEPSAAAILLAGTAIVSRRRGRRRG